MILTFAIGGWFLAADQNPLEVDAFETINEPLVLVYSDQQLLLLFGLVDFDPSRRGREQGAQIEVGRLEHFVRRQAVQLFHDDGDLGRQLLEARVEGILDDIGDEVVCNRSE